MTFINLSQICVMNVDEVLIDLVNFVFDLLTFEKQDILTILW